MANEIQVTGKLTVRKGNNALTVEVVPPVMVDQVGEGDMSLTLLIPTSDTVIDVSTLSVLGWAFFRNLDDTNYVRWGPTSGGALVPVGRMRAGESAGPFRLNPGTVLRMQANSAACLVKVTIVED